MRNQKLAYIVMRYPVLMEDEGRHHFISPFDTREEAQAWIDSQKGEYFKPGDYYIAEPSNDKKSNGSLKNS